MPILVSELVADFPNNQERRIISRKNLNEHLETLHLAPMQFGDLPGFYRKPDF